MDRPPEPPTAAFPPSAYHDSERWQSLLSPVDEFWRRLGVRIALMGGVYPIVVGGVWCVLGVVIAAGYGALEYLGPTVIVPLVASPFVFAAGFIYVGIASLMVVPAVAATLRLLGESPPRDTVGAFAGAAVGYLATLPLGLAGAAVLHYAEWFGAILALGHIAVAIAMGQAAGYLASLGDLRRRERGRLQRRPFRLTVWRLLAAMVPLSVILSVLSLADLMTPTMAAATGGALACAVATHKPVAWLVNRWLDRRLRRRRESRLAARST